MNNSHRIPTIISDEVQRALSFFPELQHVSIEFRLKKNIRNSIMLAQPIIATLLKSKHKRSYVIKISSSFKITGEEFKIEELNQDVLVGWIGHELGHIIDYQKRSSLNLLIFGLGYPFCFDKKLL